MSLNRLLDVLLLRVLPFTGRGSQLAIHSAPSTGRWRPLAKGAPNSHVSHTLLPLRHSATFRQQSCFTIRCQRKQPGASKSSNSQKGSTGSEGAENETPREIFDGFCGTWNCLGLGTER